MKVNCLNIALLDLMSHFPCAVLRPRWVYPDTYCSSPSRAFDRS